MSGRPVCNQEVADRYGNAEPCDQPATATRFDPTWGEYYPVCDEHRTPRSPEGA